MNRIAVCSISSAFYGHMIVLGQILRFFYILMIYLACYLCYYVYVKIC